MPSKRQPKDLRMCCVDAAGDMIISQYLKCPESSQEEHIKRLLNAYVPPVVFQDVFSNVIRHLGTTYAPSASASIIASFLQMLLHPRLTDVRLSDLAHIGDVELDSLDVMEEALVQKLPGLTELVHLDLSTHRFKITFPSCSDEILEVLGKFCPNLKVLNLNYNNRVTGKGIRHLLPSADRKGCRELEKLYVQDTSVEAHDVALALGHFPLIQMIGFREVGRSIGIMRRKPARYKLWNRENELQWTHIDNTMSGVSRDDGDLVQFLSDACPYIEDLKVRVCDETMDKIKQFPRLKHLELRYFTGYHHPIGSNTELYLKTCGSHLSSLSLYCNILFSQHVIAIAEECLNLKKLFLHANWAEIDTPLVERRTKLQELEMLHLRLGDNELAMNLDACTFITFLITDTKNLHELYIMVRSTELQHVFFETLLDINPLSQLRNLIIDVPKRTLAAPMLALTVDTALLFMNNCDNLKILGNLICWNVSPEDVSSLRETSRKCNYNLTIVHAHSNKLNTKYF